MELIELLIYGGLALAALAFNYAQRKRGSRGAPEAAPEAPGTQPAPLATSLPGLEEVWGREPVRNRQPPVRAAPAPAARSVRRPDPPGQRRRRHALFRSRGDIRQAVIMMTVLGPCRALAPFDSGDAAAPGPGQPGVRESKPG